MNVVSMNFENNERRDEFFAQMETALRPTLLHDGVWTADYRRLRIVAIARPDRDGTTV